MFDNFNVNLRKNEGFPTCIPCIPIPEYGQSNAPLNSKVNQQMRFSLPSIKCSEAPPSLLNVIERRSKASLVNKLREVESKEFLQAKDVKKHNLQL